MTANINKTKRHLTIVFSAIVFVVIFVLWIIFFSTKYYKEGHIEKMEIISFSNMVDSNKIDVENLWNLFPKFENFEPNISWKWWKKQPREAEFMPKEFINFILIDVNKNVLVNNIKENISEEFLLNIIEDNEYLEIKQEDSYLIKKVKLDDESTFIVLLYYILFFYFKQESIYVWIIIQLHNS